MSTVGPTRGLPRRRGPARSDHVRASLQDAPGWCRIVIRIGLVVWAAIAAVGLVTLDFNLIDPVFQVGVMMLITVFIARRIARADRDPAIFGFVMAAFSAKMLGACVRDFVTNVYYNGVADANEYHTFAKEELVSHYRVLDFSPEIGKLSGTGFMKMVTGIVYSFSGTSKFGAFAIFSWFGFLGLLLFWRAFKAAVPNGDSRRYGLLVLFLPSLLYWPSALGKDAWCLMGLGLGAFGVAMILTRRYLRGAAFMALGLLTVTWVRPHVALVLFCGLVLAALVGKSKSRSPGAPIVRIIVFGALFVIGSILASQTSSFLGVNSLNAETVDQQLNKAEGQTSKVEVGSTFSPVRVRTPIDFPLATVTVLFRPFPWEAREGPSIGTALEGVFLLWLTWRSRRRLRNLWHCMRDTPYVAFCVGYMLVFIFAFSAFSNFGILARQRAQVTPAFLVLLCIPERRRRGAPDGDPVELGASDDPYGTVASAATDDPYAAMREAAAVDPYADVRARTRRPEPPPSTGSTGDG